MNFLTFVILLVLSPLCFGDVCMDSLTRRNNKDHYADPTDCHYYYQCFFHNKTYAEGIRKQCQDGLFWHDIVLSCMPEGQTKCQDKCLDDGVSAKGYYAGTGCRQFYQCANTASYGMCCSEKTRFNAATGICDNDPECRDPCVMDAPLVTTTIAAPAQLNATTCRDSFGSMISIVSGEPRAFILLDAAGNPTKKMRCAEATVFNIVNCRCDGETTFVPRAKNGQAIIFNATFDGNDEDSSFMKFATFLFDGAKRDLSTFAHGNGSLRVNGGFISIPGMKSFDLGKAASFCAFFKCDGGSCGNGGIISNYKTAQEFTVVLGTQANNTFLAQLRFWHPIDTQTIQAKFDIPPNGWNHFCLTYDGKAMVLYLNGVVAKQVPVESFLSLSSVAYEIGRDQVLGTFNGNIDDVLITNFAMSQSNVNALRDDKMATSGNDDDKKTTINGSEYCYCDSFKKWCLDDGTYDTFFCDDPYSVVGYYKPKHCPCEPVQEQYDEECVNEEKTVFVCR